MRITPLPLTLQRFDPFKLKAGSETQPNVADICQLWQIYGSILPDLADICQICFQVVDWLPPRRISFLLDSVRRGTWFDYSV